MADDSMDDVDEGPVVWRSSNGLEFASEDLEACLKVLRVLNADKSLVQKSEFRELRKLGQVFVVKQKTPSNHKKEQRKMYSARRSAQKNADMKHAQNSAMKRQRMDALNKLLQPPEHKLLEGASEEAAEEQDDEAKDGQVLAARVPGEYVELNYPKSCYTCKAKFWRLHFFYDLLCPECAELNYTKRIQSADLRGKVAICTGARIKIGYHAVLKLLRAGAEVVAVTRFPHDAVHRFAAEEDCQTWADRLHMYGLDLRDLGAVERFAVEMHARFPRLDVIIQNAAQTIRRPPAYYAHLMEYELLPRSELPEVEARMLWHSRVEATRQWLAGSIAEAAEASGTTPATAGAVGTGGAGEEAGEARGDAGEAAATEEVVEDRPGEVHVQNAESSLFLGNPRGDKPSALLSQVALIPEDDAAVGSEAFPLGRRDEYGQQLDLRRNNSWNLKLEEVSTVEAVEVLAVNTMAPFILNARLRSLMESGPEGDKWIVNVSAMEGKFYRFKSPDHPHTNMAKAALNMMTRTSAADYAKSRIFMTSVDTGWINDENPLEQAAKYHKTNNFTCPIDEEDAAARIVAPVFDGANTGENEFGVFLKDYRVTEW